MAFDPPDTGHSAVCLFGRDSHLLGSSPRSECLLRAIFFQGGATSSRSFSSFFSSSVEPLLVGVSFAIVTVSAFIVVAWGTGFGGNSRKRITCLSNCGLS